jgi:hypothetical protein
MSLTHEQAGRVQGINYSTGIIPEEVQGDYREYLEEQLEHHPNRDAILLSYDRMCDGGAPEDQKAYMRYVNEELTANEDYRNGANAAINEAAPDGSVPNYPAPDGTVTNTAPEPMSAEQAAQTTDAILDNGGENVPVQQMAEYRAHLEQKLEGHPDKDEILQGFDDEARGIRNRPSAFSEYAKTEMSAQEKSFAQENTQDGPIKVSSAFLDAINNRDAPLDNPEPVEVAKVPVTDVTHVQHYTA